MALEPQNVTGTIIDWVAQPRLRFAGRTRKHASLQQLYRNVSTGDEEWRDVEFVHTTTED
jgi:hypothetical protein